LTYLIAHDKIAVERNAMNLFTQLLDSSARFQRQYAEHLLNRFQFLPNPVPRIVLKNQWVEPRGLTAALSSQSRVVITGASGAGKTTTLAFLAVSNARGMLNTSHPRVPLFFAASDLSPQSLPRITDLPRDLNLRPDLVTQCPKIFFPDAFNSGRAIVLIDDADLLPADQLQTWLNELKGAQVIATAQTALPGFAEFALPGFRDGDIEQFAKRWNAADASAFLASLKSSGVPRTLTGNPATLTLLTQVWKPDQPLPTRRADLFDGVMQTALDNSDETIKMLEGTALAIQRGRPASNESVSKSHGFLRLAKSRTAEFTHALWQSYFAARALRQAPNLAPLTDYLSDSNWNDVVLFYAGLGDASELVDALVARSEYTFAGRAIAHARHVRGDLRDTVTKELMQRAWDGDATATAALSEMQSDAAVDTVAGKLKDKDPAIRTRTAEILGQLQLDRGIEYLLPQLRDVNADVRDHVVAGLGHSRTDRVIEPLLVALRGDPRVGTIDTQMRIAAAKALGEIASDKALPALLVELQIGEPEVRAVAADALKRITSPLLLKPLKGITQSGDEAARKYAAEILLIMDGHL
jgi:HEAT repeat protein